jgi:hypothetical protein
MYVEFRLPSGAGGMAAQYLTGIIRKEIDQWAKQHSMEYKTKVVKYTLRLCLNSKQDYTYFQLSWKPENQFAQNFVLVEPMSS